MYRRNSWIVTAAAIASFLVVIIFLNFHVTNRVSETNFYSKEGAQVSDVLRLPHNQVPLAVVVNGSGLIADALREELARLVAEDQELNRAVVLLQPGQSPADMPTLEIDLVPHGIVWTPVMSFASIEWRVRFTDANNQSAGVVIQPMHVSMKASSSLLGSLWLRESSLGIMTWRGYRDSLGRLAAQNLNKVLVEYVANRPLAQLSFAAQ